MDLFDSAVFDSAVFDTGDVVEQNLQRFIALDRERKRRRKKEEEEQALLEAAKAAFQQLEPTDEVADLIASDIEPALEIPPVLPVYDPRLAEAVGEQFEEHITAELARIAEQQRRHALAIQLREDEEAAQALLAWLMQ